MRYKAMFFLVTAAFLLRSQNYKNDILSVSKYFTELKNYSLTMHYKLYLDNNLSKLYQERNVQIKRYNNNVWMNNTSGLEILDNENYQIVINTKDKVFAARKKFQEENQKAQVKEYQNFMQNNFDSLLLIFEKIKIIESSNKFVKYEIAYKKNSSVVKSILVIDKVKNMYQSLTVQYKDPIKINKLDGKTHLITMVLNYEDFKVNNTYSNTFFSEKNYITVKKDGVLVPLKKYAEYKLIIPEDEDI